MKRFNPSELEPKWQQIWDEQHVYTANLESDKPKYIAMSMFNYPSGNLHIGHAMNFTISDVMARFKRQQGFESYHPVGWDSFGLPAENRAIKEGLSPQESMAELIPDYRKAYKAMGWSNDWSREIATHEPSYYKWTQWIFSEMYRAGLAYQDARMQWWCTQCQTVLANEQVIDCKCWRHDGPNDPEVQKKEVKQWFFKVSEYADEMLEATDDLNWTESVKMAQKNWIGKSVGAEVTFASDAGAIDVFTTRPDTIFGATFLVLAPEHELVRQLTTSEQKDAVESYIKKATAKSELERMADVKEKSGVFTGAYATNPANDKKIPIWIADYVLGGYGTGAIMAVPAHDERDKEFAEKFGLDIIDVVDEDSQLLINSGDYNKLDVSDAREKIVSWLEEKGAGKAKTTYRIRDWSISRQRYWGAPIPIVNCESCGPQLVDDTELPIVLPELKDFQPSGDGRSALARATDWLVVDCPSCGGKGERETDTLDTYICSSWYMLRYFDPHNNEKAFDSRVVNKWMPIDFYNGADHATAHMIYARFVTRFLHKQGLLNTPEPFDKFLFNGKVTAGDGTMFSKSKGNGIDPLEIINQGYGADALRTYLMFAAPLDVWARWDQQGVPGTHRFLNRIWNITQEFLMADKFESSDESVLRIIHPAIKKVSHDIEHQKYNTAIAAMMKATNELYELKAKGGFENTEAWKFALESLVSLVAPFAPHMADELWSEFGHTATVHKESWPQWEEKFIVSDTLTIAVQVNGKLRSTISVPVDTDAEEVKSLAQNDENVRKHLANKEPTKVIYVPGRLVNIVG